MKSEATKNRRRPTCPFCGRKRLRAVGKHLRKCEKAQAIIAKFSERLPVWTQ